MRERSAGEFRLRRYFFVTVFHAYDVIHDLLFGDQNTATGASNET